MSRSSAVLKDLIGNEPAWQELARCTQADPEQWFPEKGGATALAVRVCQRCPVRVECLEWALERREPYGIWGGRTERERASILRRGGQRLATAA